MPKTILIASNNKGKQAEILALLKNEKLILRTPQDLSISLDVDEIGNTYEENARIKAIAFRDVSGFPALADDSGLEVDALNGSPGLFSARFLQKQPDEYAQAVDSSLCVYDGARAARWEHSLFKWYMHR